MIRAICQCKSKIYIDQETGKKFDHPSSEYPHRCQSQPIPLYVREFYYHKQYVKLDFYVPESEQVIASKIVQQAVNLGLNPYVVKTERRGDNLYIILR